MDVQAYNDGFVTKCAELGVDPQVLVKAAGGPLATAFQEKVKKPAAQFLAKHQLGMTNPVRKPNYKALARDTATRNTGYANPAAADPADKTPMYLGTGKLNPRISTKDWSVAPR